VPVAGDDICTATNLTASATTACTGSVTGNVSGATPSPQAICAGFGPVNDVWFSFLAVNANQTINVDGIGLFDAVVQVYSSSNNLCSGTLTQIACYDQFGDDENETVGLTGLTVGNRYFVRVHDVFSGAPPNTTFTICVTTPPGNDQCANATALTIGGAPISGTLTSATQTNGSNRNDVWYTFTPCSTAVHTITIDNFSSAGDRDLYIYSACPATYPGTTVATGTGVSTTNEVVTATFNAGTTYYILVQDFARLGGTFNIQVTGVTANLGLSNTGTPPAGFVNAGTTNTTLFGFALTPQCGATNYNVTGVTIANTGTATATDLTNARMFYDANNNGAWDGGDVLCSVAVPVSGSMAFTITGQNGVTGTRRYILVANVATGALGGNTFNGTGATVTTSLPNAGTAVGNTITIRPINNNCAGAIVFPPLTAGCNNMFVNTGGADQSQVANCGGNADDDVWFTFTMPIGYSAIAFSNTNISGNGDRRLEFYSGTCGSLTPVPSGCFDAETGNLSGLTPGATYYVRAYTTGAAVSSQFTLCIALTPANDDCAGAIVFPALAPGCTNVDVNTLAATQSLAGCSGTADDDVWYQFTMPIGYTALSYSMTDISGNNDRIIEFFSSSCGVGGFNCTTNETGNLTGLTAGATYWLRTYTAGIGVSSNFTLCLALPPVNDDCANAIAFPALAPGCTSVDVSTGAATASPAGAPCTGTADDDVWYSFVLSSPSVVGYSMTNISGNTDRVIQIFNACGGTQVWCSTNESGVLTSQPAGTYYVRVFTAGSGVNSNFELCIALPPANDNVCNATLLSTPEICTSTQGTVQMATASAGSNGIGAGCAGNADDDVWYKFVAGSTSHTVTVDGSVGFNAVIQAYTGACPTLAAMTPITCGDATGVGGTEVLVLKGLTVGTTYHVRVYDKATGASTSPTFDICITENPLGVPIAYYDFEDNAARNTITSFQIVAEVGTNSTSSFARSGGTFTGQTGPGIDLHAGTGAGTAIVGTPADDPTATTSPVSYLDIPLNASGFQTLSISFDLFCNQITGTHPYVGVNFSTNGGATWSSLVLLNTTVPNAWQLLDPVTLPASCNDNANVKIRIYGYNASLYNPTFAIDNFTLYAASTAVGAGTKTLVSFPVVYTGKKSGSTGAQYSYDKFTANGAGSIVALTASDIILDNALIVTNSGTFNFGTGVTPRYLTNGGAATFTLDPTGTLGITDAAGITSSGATGNIRSTGARAYSTSGNYTYMDNAAQVTGNGLPATVNNLTINNSAGVTLTGTGVTVNGTLALTAGILRTATFATDNIIMGPSGVVTQTAGWVYGNLRKPVAAGNPVRSFEVGNLANYTPVIMSFTAVTTPGSYTVRAITPSHPNIGSSCLSNTQKVNAYYKLVNGGVSPANYSADFSYTPAELVGAPTLANLVVGKYDLGTWTYPTVSGTPTNTNTIISNGSGDGEYQIAQGVVPSVTIGVSPAGNTCPGTSLLFTATPTNGGTPTYEFFENGVSMQNSASNTYSSTTVTNGQLVTVAMTSNAGCITTATVSAVTPVTVSRYPAPVLSATDPAGVCSPSTVSLVGVATDANATTGTFSYYATSADAQAATNAISPTISTTGTYFIRKTTTTGGCFDIVSVDITIFNVPSLTITNPPPTCIGGTVDITVPGIANDVNGASGSFSYFPTLVDAQNNTNALAAPEGIGVSGTYYIKKTTLDGCFDIKPVVVTIQTCGTLTWEGDISTDWHIPGNWNLNYVPTTTDNVIIPNVANDPVVSTADGNCQNVQINAGAVITVTSPYILFVKGDWSGAANIVSGTGKTTFFSSVPQTITGGATFSTLVIDNTNGITIAAGAPKVRVTTALELKAGQLTTNGNFVTVSTALNTAYIDDFSSGMVGTLSGNVAVERYITNGPNGYRYIGAPVATTAGGSTLNLSALSGFVISGIPGQTIPLPTCSPTNSAMNSPYGTFMRWEEAGPFTYNCRQAGWWFQTTGTMTIGRGYGAKVGSGTKITYTGAANTGSISYGPLANSGPIGNGWHLVSNPFPSSMAISNIDGNANNNMPAGFNGQIQLYITSGPYTGSYLAYNTGLVTAPFALGQGFWVQSTGSGTFTVNNNYRVTNQVNYYDVNSDIQHHLKVDVAGNGFMDKTDIYFLPTAQTGFDFYDAEKWESRSDQPTLYTKVGSQSTAINSLPSLQETVVVPMGVKPGTNGNYTFTFEDIATFPQTSMIYLEDLQLGTMNNLRENNTYSFTANVNDNADRFMLHFQPGLQAEVADQDCDNAGSIELTQPAPTIWSTYEVRGNDNNVYAQGTDFTGSTTITNLPPQEYVVTVTHASGYSAQEYITVNGNSPVNATINASATNVMVDEMVSLTGTATDATEYDWNFGDGNTQSGSSTVVHAYDAEGVYTVSMTASNSTCNDVASKVINVTKTTTGINGTEATNVKIYGQGERVVIEFNNWGGNKADIFMYNALGQRVESLTGVSTLKGRQELYIADIIPGTYFIQVVSDGKIQGKKVFLGKH
jgi:hypothetical protein